MLSLGVLESAGCVEVCYSFVRSDYEVTLCRPVPTAAGAYALVLSRFPFVEERGRVEGELIVRKPSAFPLLDQGQVGGMAVFSVASFFLGRFRVALPPTGCLAVVVVVVMWFVFVICVRRNISFAIFLVFYTSIC